MKYIIAIAMILIMLAFSPAEGMKITATTRQGCNSQCNFPGDWNSCFDCCNSDSCNGSDAWLGCAYTCSTSNNS